MDRLVSGIELMGAGQSQQASAPGYPADGLLNIPSLWQLAKFLTWRRLDRFPASQSALLPASHHPLMEFQKLRDVEQGMISKAMPKAEVMPV